MSVASLTSFCPCLFVDLFLICRCDQYRAKIRDHELAQEGIVAARKRNEVRSALIPVSKFKIKNVSSDLLRKHMVNACNESDKAKILSLGSRGCTCNVETPRGMRPLTVVQTQSPSNEELGQLLKFRGADVNAVNKYGMSAVMLACRMKDTKTILYYMETAGAEEAVSEGTRGLGRTALHYCAIHNSEEAAKILFDNVAKVNDVMRSIKFIDAQDSEGNTALIAAGVYAAARSLSPTSTDSFLCFHSSLRRILPFSSNCLCVCLDVLLVMFCTPAKVGNGIMCRTLLQLGANPILQNKAKRTAAIEARENRYLYLADWLAKKVTKLLQYRYCVRVRVGVVLQHHTLYMGSICAFWLICVFMAVCTGLGGCGWRGNF